MMRTADDHGGIVDAASCAEGVPECAAIDIGVKELVWSAGEKQLWRGATNIEDGHCRQSTRSIGGLDATSDCWNLSKHF